ncbi:MAG: hypothetical protein GKR87_13400 [Kiritimatiellae bacterium]|nr:hypothetical protein [Kiritimatiellia bacterium]
MRRLEQAQREAENLKLGVWAIERVSSEKELRIRPSNPLKTYAPNQPKIEEQVITLKKTIPIFSLKNVFKQVGTLYSGAKVYVLGSESRTMVRIRFKASSNKVYEAQCQRVDLDL